MVGVESQISLCYLAWVVNLASKLLSADGDKEFVMKFNEGLRGFLAQRCKNKAVRYVAVAEYGERSRRGVIIIPEGRGGVGWKALEDCFQEVVDHLGRSRNGRVTVEDGGRREGVSFVDVVKGGPLLALSSPLFSRLFVSVTGGKKWSRAEKMKSHTDQEANVSMSNILAINAKVGNIDMEGIFCPKHIGERLLGLRLKLDRIIGSLNYVEDIGLKREGPSCFDCSLEAHQVGSTEVPKVTHMERGGQVGLGLG